MYRKNMLKLALVQNNKRMRDLRDFLGISPPTMTKKMKTGDFSREQIEAMAAWLHIQDVREVFFYQEAPDENAS